jgi:hypothetical protein
VGHIHFKPQLNAINHFKEKLDLDHQNDDCHKTKQTITSLPSHLRGLPQNRWGGHRTQRLRGFRGWSRGSAGPVKRYTKEECKTVEQEMVQHGEL